MAPTPPRLLVIAGSDSSAGAGLQADLKTAFAFGVYAQTVVTAVTVQNTRGVSAVHPVPADVVRAQIEACLSDIGADAIKIGMLGNGAVAVAVADALEGADAPLVLDTVLASSSGAALLDDAGIAVLKKRLIPRAALVTPNLPEVQALVGVDATTEHGLRNALQVFTLLGCPHVLFKGGHRLGPRSHAGATNPSLDRDPATATSSADAAEDQADIVEDVLGNGDTGALLRLSAPRQITPHTHGTGCTLATAIACGLAEGMTLAEAVARAHRYVQAAIRAAPGLGDGHGPLGHRV